MSPELDWLIAEFGEGCATTIMLSCQADPSQIDTICIREYEPFDPKRQTFRKSMRAVLEQMDQMEAKP